MQKNTPMRPEDEAGLENASPHCPVRVRTCPICNQVPPVSGGGVGWKWLSVHLGEHLGYMWDAREGWLKVL